MREVAWIFALVGCTVAVVVISVAVALRAVPDDASRPVWTVPKPDPNLIPAGTDGCPPAAWGFNHCLRLR